MMRSSGATMVCPPQVWLIEGGLLPTCPKQASGRRPQPQLAPLDVEEMFRQHKGCLRMSAIDIHDP